MENAQTDIQRQITATILKLRQRSPFFATLALFARVIVSETITRTAATDGRDIYINPIFWAAMNREERLGVFTHEVLHAALLHVPRCGKTRDPLLWNVAADIVVNGMLVANKFELPAGHIRDVKLEHLSVEEIYHLLLPLAQKYVLLDGGDLIYNGVNGDLDEGEHKALEAYWRMAVQQGQLLAQAQGNQPAGMLRELEHLNPAQLDWRSYLWRFLVRTPTDFQDFDRRFVGEGLYLDNFAGESVRVYICVDTSGSVGSKEMRIFLSEVTGILGSYPHIKAQLYYADAACYGPYELAKAGELPKPVGGGGTNFRPFFEAVQREDDGQQGTGLCIYLTDGYGTFPQEEPALSTLWVLSPGGIDTTAVPFGEAVRLIPDA
jgi:predicted metal-dependent peptidase